MKKFAFKQVSSAKRVAKVDLSHLDRQLSNIPAQKDIRIPTSSKNNNIPNIYNQQKDNASNNSSASDSNTNIKVYFNKLSFNKSNLSQEQGKIILF